MAESSALNHPSVGNPVQPAQYNGQPQPIEQPSQPSITRPGRPADTVNPNAPLTEAERALLRKMLDAYQEQPASKGSPTSSSSPPGPQSSLPSQSGIDVQTALMIQQLMAQNQGGKNSMAGMFSGQAGLPGQGMDPSVLSQMMMTEMMGALEFDSNADR